MYPSAQTLHWSINLSLPLTPFLGVSFVRCLRFQCFVCTLKLHIDFITRVGHHSESYLLDLCPSIWEVWFLRYYWNFQINELDNGFSFFHYKRENWASSLLDKCHLGGIFYFIASVFFDTFFPLIDWNAQLF